MQPDIPYHKWEESRNEIEFLDKEPKTKEEALTVARNSYEFTFGVFYQTSRKSFHKGLYRDHNPITNRLSRDTRLDKIRKILGFK
ncbi:hypothetical protein ES705_04939 [subsurface metagenome]